MGFLSVLDLMVFGCFGMVYVGVSPNGGFAVVSLSSGRHYL